MNLSANSARVKQTERIGGWLFLWYFCFWAAVTYGNVGSGMWLPAAVVLVLRFAGQWGLLEELRRRYGGWAYQAGLILLLSLGTAMSVYSEYSIGMGFWVPLMFLWLVIWAAGLSLAVGHEKRVLFVPSVGLVTLLMAKGGSSQGLIYPANVAVAGLFGVLAAASARKRARDEVPTIQARFRAAVYALVMFTLLGLPVTALGFLVFPRLPEREKPEEQDDAEARKRGAVFKMSGGGFGILPEPDLRFGHEMLLSERPAFFAGFPDADRYPVDVEKIYWRADACATYSHGRWIDDTRWRLVQEPYSEMGGDWVKVSQSARGIGRPHVVAPAAGRYLDRIPGVHPVVAVGLSEEMPALAMNAEGGLAPYRAHPGRVEIISGPVVQFWDMAQGATARHPDPKYTSTVGIPDALRDKAGEIAGTGSAYARITALREYLFSTCRYSFRYAAAPGVDPVEEFVFKRKQGSCALFASALTLMLRSVDVPARLVSGFKGGISYRGSRDTFIVRECDAHAWVEVYFEGIGWLPVEATPATTAEIFVDGRRPSRWNEPSTYDLVYSWWNKHIVGFTARKQREVVRTTLASARDWIAGVIAHANEWAWRAAVVFVLLVGAGLAVKIVLMIRKSRFVGGERLSKGPFYDLLRTLGRLGLHRRVGETPLEFALALAKAPGELPSMTKAVRLFYAWRYGGHDTHAALSAEVNNIMARLPRQRYALREDMSAKERNGGKHGT